MKATEQYFPVVLCIMLYKAVQWFEQRCSVVKTLKISHDLATDQYFPLNTNNVLKN